MIAPVDIDKPVPVVGGGGTLKSFSMITKPAYSTKKIPAFVLGLTSIAILQITTIVLVAKLIKESSSSNNAISANVTANDHSIVDFLESMGTSSFLDAEDDNVCAGAALVFESKLCVDFDVPTPQAGANVTRGYIGQLDVNGILPNTKRFWKSAMCPVNVHW